MVAKRRESIRQLPPAAAGTLVPGQLAGFRPLNRPAQTSDSTLELDSGGLKHILAVFTPNL